MISQCVFFFNKKNKIGIERYKYKLCNKSVQKEKLMKLASRSSETSFSVNGCVFVSLYLALCVSAQYFNFTILQMIVGVAVLSF